MHYNDKQKEITWSAGSEKLPGFLIDLQNELKVVEIDGNTCQVTTNITAELTGIRGVILGAPIKNNFTKLLKGFVKDWKTYSETGLVSDIKKRELAKF
jgi:hypothetical protein